MSSPDVSYFPVICNLICKDRRFCQAYMLNWLPIEALNVDGT